MIRSPKPPRAIAFAALTLASAACSKSTTRCTDNDGGLATVGGAVLGPVDNHCYRGPSGAAPGSPLAAQVTHEAACPTTAGFYDDGGPPSAQLVCGFSADGGPAGCTPPCDYTDGGPEGCAPSYGATLYNSAGTDDDCKYQTSWTSTPIVRDGNTTFYFTALHTIDGTPATGANVFAEVYLPSANHISPSTQPPVQETPVGSGAYTIGPVVFDLPGMWTIRFHLREECGDRLPDSPHGHAAFYVNVP